jgi:hypothetical protein
MPEESSRRRTGRPPLTAGDTPATVNLTLPSADYDRAFGIAQRERSSVLTVLRRVIRRGLREELDDDRDG